MNADDGYGRTQRLMGAHRPCDLATSPDGCAAMLGLHAAKSLGTDFPDDVGRAVDVILGPRRLCVAERGDPKRIGED